MCTVTRGRKTKTVKNLGWLARHVGEVASVEIAIYPKGYSHNAGKMTVCMDDNRTIFESEWASLTVCRQWLRARRALKEIPLVWGGYHTVCGSLRPF